MLVEIGDTGSGIPPELRDKIFEPFFTTKPVGEGTGLGLDICYRVVTQRHGGDLRVVSEPGDTRFQVRSAPVATRPRLTGHRQVVAHGREGLVGVRGLRTTAGRPEERS